MGLSWDITKIEGGREKINAEGLQGVMDALIWSTMAVGMGEIAAEGKCGYERFAARLDFVQKVRGPFLRKAVKGKDGKTRGKEIPITAEMVKRFIGLRTNVSYETPATWEKRFLIAERRGW